MATRRPAASRKAHDYVQEAATHAGMPLINAVVGALQAEFRPVKIMKGSSDAKNTLAEGCELDVVVVAHDFAESIENVGVDAAVEQYCQLAVAALGKAADRVALESRRSTAHGMKLKVHLRGGAAAGAIDVLFTGEAEASADGSPDPYFLSFYSLEQVSFVRGSMATFTSPSLHDAVVTLKAAAKGLGFKGYFLELVAVLEFQQNSRMHSAWANVALDVRARPHTRLPHAARTSTYIPHILRTPRTNRRLRYPPTTQPISSPARFSRRALCTGGHQPARPQAVANDPMSRDGQRRVRARRLGGWRRDRADGVGTRAEHSAHVGRRRLASEDLDHAVGPAVKYGL